MRQSWLRLALIACAMRAMPLAAQSSMSVPTSTAEPRAALRSSALGDPQVVIFKPSYLAVFEVVPYGGIAQLYPMSVAEGSELLKESTLMLSASRTAEARRASARGVHLVASGTGTSAPRASRTPPGSLRPRSMVLLASDRPFRVGAPNVTLGQLASEMTGLRVPRVFVGEDEDIAKLVARVRPVSPEADLTVDVLALPPDASDFSAVNASDVGALREVPSTCGVANVVIDAELASKLRCDVSAPISDREQGAALVQSPSPAEHVRVLHDDPSTATRSDAARAAAPAPKTSAPVPPAPAAPPAPAPPPVMPKRDAAPTPTSREKPIP